MLCPTDVSSFLSIVAFEGCSPNTLPTFIMNAPMYDIPVECPCGYQTVNSLSKRHLTSTAHSRALIDLREAAKMATTGGGNCIPCNLTIKKNLEKHCLTNLHIYNYVRWATREIVLHRRRPVGGEVGQSGGRQPDHPERVALPSPHTARRESANS